MKMNTWVIVAATFSFFYNNAFAWNDTLAHKPITREAVKASYYFDHYLQSQLDIRGGRYENFNGMPLEEWLQLGAEMEDAPSCRASNHWNWQSAKQYFYAYLTGLDLAGHTMASDETTRNTYLAKSFQALGQVMHLLQDVALPAPMWDDFSLGRTRFFKGADT